MFYIHLTSLHKMLFFISFFNHFQL